MKKQIGFTTVALQFRFLSMSAVPPFTRRLKQQPVRRDPSLPSGEMIVEPAEGSSLVTFLADIKAAGYRLVNAVCEERANVGGPGCHYIARFIFSQTEQVDGRFRSVHRIIERELLDICEGALWRVRAFSNPLIKQSKVVPGYRTANVVLEARRPFMQGDGQPVTVWQKDAAGERIGDAPLPLKPSHLLRFADNTVNLLAA